MDKVIVLSSDDEEDKFKFDYGTINLKFSEQSTSTCRDATNSKNWETDLFNAPSLDYVRLSPKPCKIKSASGYDPKESCYTSLNAGSLNGKTRSKLSRVTHDLSDSDENDETTVSLKRTSQSSDDELPDINLGLTKPSIPTKNKAIIHYRKKENSNNYVENKTLKPLELTEKAKQRQATKDERERKKKEAAHVKALKKASAEIERAEKPGECMKWVSAIIDPGLLNAEYSGELLTALRGGEIDYKVEEFIIPCSISWERRLQNVCVDGDMNVQKTTVTQREPFVLIVWMWNKVIEHIHENTFGSAVEEIMSLLPDSEITLVIFGLEDYFQFQKTKKRRDVRSEVLKSGPQKRKIKEGTFEAAPQVSRGDVEYALAELQVLSSVSHRCVNTKADLASLVCQFFKAIAEAPFKRKKNKKNADRLDWYALGDSKDCITVDKDGNGSLQMWLRQLTLFPLASRETSEAIASVYPSPASLLQAYENCSDEESAQHLLENIPVRRGPGPLLTTRRIGPQLSKKIHTFFTSFDETCTITSD